MPVMSDREYRRAQRMEARGDDGAHLVTGYATTFGEEYCLYDAGDFRMMESVDAHAFDGCDMSDVIMQYDHEGRVFARTKNGTLRLTPDEHGLRIDADLSGTEIGRQLYEEIAGGFTDKMSFGFRVNGEKRWEETVDGVTVEHRIITGISKLYDVSAVSLPANDATEISARMMGEGALARITEERRASQERRRKIQTIKTMLEVLKE